MSLAKQPASTVQILGAEKALFRALKTKAETPKYGLIYHASLIGQSAPKFKGKISRVLAAKCAALVDESSARPHIGPQPRRVAPRVGALLVHAWYLLGGTCT
jgi:RNA processing factor Prp31